MKWINVNDRLPNEEECNCSKECLVVCKTIGGYEGSYVSVEKANFYPNMSADEFSIGNYTWYWSITTGEMNIPFIVTHWMPLPEPPQ